MDQATQILQESFGHSEFRGVQEQVIKRLIVEGKNTLVLMPTGGGKSLCFQIPALCFEGLTLVVSPLIALMKDQVTALKKRGIAAASMDSSLSTEEMAQVRTDLRAGSLKILYVPPERLNNEMFVAMMKDQKVALLAVDESHCVSEWGHSFRPDYLKVARFSHEVQADRVLCLTATATLSVVKDICDAENGFDIDVEHGVFSTGAYRPNLSLQIKPASNFQAKTSLIVPFLESLNGASAIIYVTTHAMAEELAEDLQKRGVPDVKFYHAGMKAEDRKATQDWFIDGEGIVVATIAFGMGIDKANIRAVIHFSMPKTLENYSQEVGRAGRDGLPATCIMTPSGLDYPILEGFARANTPSKKSMREWLTDVFRAPIDPDDNTINFSQYEQARNFDIGATSLSLLFANLELQFGLIRAVTPMYTMYKLKANESNPTGFQQVLKANTPEAIAMQRTWKKGPKWITVDVIAAAEKSGLTRAEIVRQISQWEYNGLVETNLSGVRHRFTVLKPLPQSDEEIEEMTTNLTNQYRKREEAEVKRLRELAAFCRSDQCYAHVLASYFGDTTSVPNGKCGNCTYCKTQKPVAFDVANANPFTEKQIRYVLAICGVRDDSRLLAKVAYGVTSPRITALGLSKHEIFGILDRCDFNELCAKFEEICQECGYKNRAIQGPPPKKKDDKDDDDKAGPKRIAPSIAKLGGTKKKARLS